MQIYLSVGLSIGIDVHGPTDLLMWQPRSEAVTTSPAADILSAPGKDADVLDSLFHPPDPAGLQSESYGVTSYQVTSFLQHFFHMPVPVTYCRTTTAARTTVS